MPCECLLLVNESTETPRTWWGSGCYADETLTLRLRVVHEGAQI